MRTPRRSAPRMGTVLHRAGHVAAWNVLVALAATACIIEPTAPRDAAIACGDDDDCPTGFLCLEQIGRCIPHDALGKIAAQPPQVVITSVGFSDGSRPQTDVPITAIVSDPNGPPAGDETVTLAIEYTLADVMDPAPTWHPGSALDPATVVGIAAPPEGTTLSLAWRAVADAAAAGPLASHSVDTDGDDLADTEVLTAVAAVRVRLVATDSNGKVSTAAEAAPLSVGDTLPIARLNSFAGLTFVSGLVPLGIRVEDAEGDLTDVELQFRVAGGPWRTVAVTLGSLENIVPAPGVDHVVVWDSRVSPNDSDLSVPQGVGNITSAEVDLRVRASNAPSRLARHWGTWSAAVALPEVRNQTSPRIVDVTVRRAELTLGVAPALIRYRVVDEEADPVSLEVAYTTDLGATWQPCNEYALAESEGRRDLASAAQAADGGGGVEHAFAWDPAGQLAPSDTTQLRLTVDDGKSLPTSLLFSPARPVGPTEDAIRAAFTEVAEHPVGSEPQALISADVDADGILDLVAAAATSNTITVFLGNGTDGVGDGSFTAGAPLSLPAGSFPQELAAGQLTGSDTHLDLVAANALGTVSVLRGDGSGGFSAPSQFAAGGQARSVVIADLDQDGVQDLVVANDLSTEPGTLSILFGLPRGGTANGTFAAPQSYDVGMRTMAVAAGDFDEDGDVDLVCANEGDGDLSVLLNVGDGTFAPQVRYPAGDRPSFVLVVDLDLDGHTDLAANNTEAGGSVAILLGAGDGTFGAATFFPGAAKSLVSADFNGDAVPDLAGAYTGGDQLAVLLGIGSPQDPTGNFARPVGFPAGQSPWAMATGDFNADGLADLAATNNLGDSLSILLASGGQTATSTLFAAPMVQPVHESVMSVVVGDLDTDGYADVVTANADGEVAVYLGSGHLGINDGRFTLAAVLPQSVSLRRLALGDLDDDGVLDLVALSRYDEQALVLLGTGTADGGFFTAAVSYPTGAFSEDVVIADLSSDEIDDLAFAVEGERKISVFLGNGAAGRGDGTFQWSADYDVSLLPLTGSQPGPRALAVADMNGDGIADLICANAIGVSGGEVAVLRGNGSNGQANGTFRAPLTATLPGAPNRLRAADLDGDGFVDLIATRRFTSPNLVVLRGRGDGTVAPLVAYASGGMPFDLAVADVTGDGVLDAIIASSQLAVVPGEAAGGIGTGAFGAPVLQPETIAAESMALHDLNADGVLDAVIASRSRNTLSLMFGQLTTYQTAARPVARWQSDPRAPTVAIGDETLPVATGSPDDVPPSLSQRLAPMGQDGSASAEGWLAKTGLAPPTGMIPITHRWRVQGDLRLARVPEPWDAVTTGPRLRVQSRFGPLLSPVTPGDARRAGLDLTPAAFAEQRGLIITLPLPSAVGDADLSGAAVRLFHAAPDWLRADGCLLDPAAGQAQAADYLPRIPNTSPVGAAEWADLIIERPQYREIPRDADGDLSTGVGPRFIVDLTDPAQRRIRVLTDALGDFQAFREP